MQRISRRKFAQIASAAGLAGTALMEKMYGEFQDSGTVSRENVRAFLELSGTKMREDQIVPLQASLERALDSLKRVRDRSVPQTVEPVVAFRVRR
jgi:hypothetical protein